MAVLVWLLAAGAVGLALWGPKRWYWRVQAPLRRNPTATEPSDAGYALAAFANWVVAGILVVVAIAVTASEAHVYTDEEIRDIVSSAASDIDADPNAADILFNVEAVIYKHGKQSKLRITEVSDLPAPESTSDDIVQTVDGYEVTNSKKRHPYCLKVTITEEYPHLTEQHASADYDRGRCESGT